MSGDDRCASANRIDWLVAVIVCAIVGLAYVRFVGNALFGSDTWPWLQSSRLSGPPDVVRLAFSPIMPGTRFEAEVARFYHPVTSLTYALDLGLFGLNSVALYATNLVIHLLAVVGLYALLRTLGATAWAAAAGALVFGLHPIAAATVPSLPRRQDLVVAALLVWSMWCLGRAHLLDRPNWPMLLASLALFGLALGGKEIAYPALLVVPLVVLAGHRAVRDSRRPTYRRLLGAVAAFTVVEALAFAVRWRVLGGLGGYYGSERFFGSLDGLVEYFVRPYVTLSLWPAHGLMPERLRDWLVVVGVAGAVLAIAILSLSRPMRRLALLGILWQFGFLALYVVVHTSLSAYLLYVPSIGLALVVVAVLQGAAARLRIEANRARQAGLAASLAGAALLALSVLRTSALMVSYTEWQDAGFVSSAFLSRLVPCVREAPAGTRVLVDDLPHHLEYGTDESRFIDAFVFEPYSLDAAVAVLAPDARVQIDAASIADVRRRPNSIAVACLPAGESMRVGVDLRD